MISDKEKIRVYEELLHSIQLYAEVSMDNEKLSKLIRNICNWSYAHRLGNGMLSEEEQNEFIQERFNLLLER
jgi:cobalamin biosynthesis Mg chelatase CobN